MTLARRDKAQFSQLNLNKNATPANVRRKKTNTPTGPCRIGQHFYQRVDDHPGNCHRVSLHTGHTTGVAPSRAKPGPARRPRVPPLPSTHGRRPASSLTTSADFPRPYDWVTCYCRTRSSAPITSFLGAHSRQPVRLPCATDAAPGGPRGGFPDRALPATSRAVPGILQWPAAAPA